MCTHKHSNSHATSARGSTQTHNHMYATCVRTCAHAQQFPHIVYAHTNTQQLLHIVYAHTHSNSHALCTHTRPHSSAPGNGHYTSGLRMIKSPLCTAPARLPEWDPQTEVDTVRGELLAPKRVQQSLFIDFSSCWIKFFPSQHSFEALLLGFLALGPSVGFWAGVAGLSSDERKRHPFNRPWDIQG